jgi:hypothetical protein
MVGQNGMCFFVVSLGKNLALFARPFLAGSLANSILKIVIFNACPHVDAISPIFLFSSLGNE